MLRPYWLHLGVSGVWVAREASDARQFDPPVIQTNNVGFLPPAIPIGSIQLRANDEKIHVNKGACSPKYRCRPECIQSRGSRP